MDEEKNEITNRLGDRDSKGRINNAKLAAKHVPSQYSQRQEVQFKLVQI